MPHEYNEKIKISDDILLCLYEQTHITGPVIIGNVMSKFINIGALGESKIDVLKNLYFALANASLDILQVRKYIKDQLIDLKQHSIIKELENHHLEIVCIDEQ